MVDIDLLNKLEKISCFAPHRILKVERFILKENLKELLEIIITEVSVALPPIQLK